VAVVPVEVVHDAALEAAKMASATINETIDLHAKETRVVIKSLLDHKKVSLETINLGEIDQLLQEPIHVRDVTMTSQETEDLEDAVVGFHGTTAKSLQHDLLPVLELRKAQEKRVVIRVQTDCVSQ
jgi:hypothetical protein